MKNGVIGILVLSGVLAVSSRSEVVASPDGNSRYQLLMRTHLREELAREWERLLEKARGTLAAGIMRRAMTLEELEDGRPKPSGGAVRIEDPERRFRFSLATSDSNAGSVLVLELPVVAAAYSITGDEAFLGHVRAQLAEIATWDPLQRPGWTLGGGKGPPPPGSDGVWLATGWVIRAVGDTLALLPPDVLDARLRADLDRMLDREIGYIAGDWRSKIPWYVKSERVNSNQWVVPAEGLIRACLLRGADRYPDEYELGVKSLLRSFEAQGENGEFTEGLTYASITVRGMLSAAEAMARAGDDRLVRHPFLMRTGTWFAHHVQPGGFLVNAFDTLNGARGQLSVFGNIFALLAVSTDNPHALWVLRDRGLAGSSLEYLLARGMDENRMAEPPLWAHYQVGTRVVWRSSWNDDTATGVWLRGGGSSDFHDHADRGHVNFIIGKKALLIEAGTPPYGTPESDLLFTGHAGHNVLQVGDEMRPRSDTDTRVAPIRIVRLDDAGGEVEVDASACYPDVGSWIRHVEWTHEEMRVRDVVTLTQAAPLTFRWHTGEDAGVATLIERERTTIGAVRFDYQSDVAIDIAVDAMSDATMRAKTINRHTVLVVSSREPTRAMTLETIIRLAPER